MKKFTSAILVAAGNSTRMGLPFSKQFIPLCGMYAIEHTIRAFQQCEEIDEIVIVARSEDIESIGALAFDYTKVSAVIKGGETRTESVAIGTRNVRTDAEILAIHDGARCLITPDEITRAVRKAFETGAAALGTRVTDTIKTVGEDAVITGTPDRASLWAVQTPQVFERGLYMNAMLHAQEHHLSVTDDCALVEAIGVPVSVVEGEYTNIKLTTQADISMAEAILMSRAGGSVFLSGMKGQE